MSWRRFKTLLLRLNIGLLILLWGAFWTLYVTENGLAFDGPLEGLAVISTVSVVMCLVVSAVVFLLTHAYLAVRQGFRDNDRKALGFYAKLFILTIVVPIAGFISSMYLSGDENNIVLVGITSFVAFACLAIFSAGAFTFISIFLVRLGETRWDP